MDRATGAGNSGPAEAGPETMRTDCYRNDRGITLIELLIVLAIMGIVLVAAGFSYTGWLAKYKIESEVKMLKTDLDLARTRAYNRQRSQFITIGDTDADGNMDYMLYEDANNNNIYNDGSETAFWSKPKPFEDKYPMINGDGTIILNENRVIQFNTNGTVTIVMKADGSSVSNSTTIVFSIGQIYGGILPGGQNDPACPRNDTDKCPDRADYDCINVLQTMTKIGQWDQDDKLPMSFDDDRTGCVEK